MIAYPTASLSHVYDGCKLDVRVKFAMALLQVPGFATSEAAVKLAFDLAEATYAEALSRKWLEPLDSSTMPTDAEIASAKRNAVAQVEAQIHANEYGQRRTSRLLTPKLNG